MVSHRLLTPALAEIMESHGIEEVGNRTRPYLIQVSIRVCNNNGLRRVGRGKTNNDVAAESSRFGVF